MHNMVTTFAQGVLQLVMSIIALITVSKNRGQIIQVIKNNSPLLQSSPVQRCTGNSWEWLNHGKGELEYRPCRRTPFGTPLPKETGIESEIPLKQGILFVCSDTLIPHLQVRKLKRLTIHSYTNSKENLLLCKVLARLLYILLIERSVKIEGSCVHLSEGGIQTLLSFKRI